MNWIDELLDERQETYGSSWWHTGNIIRELAVRGQLGGMLNGDFFFPWIMILNKLIRALASPNDIDHWRDIIGYASIVFHALDAAEGDDAGRE